MISYHIVTSFGISFSVIACSRAYLVKLVAHIWLSLKASGEKGSKSEKIQKKRGKILRKSQKRKNHKLLSKRESSCKEILAPKTHGRESLHLHAYRLVPSSESCP